MLGKVLHNCSSSSLCQHTEVKTFHTPIALFPQPPKNSSPSLSLILSHSLLLAGFFAAAVGKVFVGTAAHKIVLNKKGEAK